MLGRWVRGCRSRGATPSLLHLNWRPRFFSPTGLVLFNTLLSRMLCHLFSRGEDNELRPGRATRAVCAKSSASSRAKARYVGDVTTAASAAPS
jgi:hypothetical protein